MKKVFCKLLVVTSLMILSFPTLATARDDSGIDIDTGSIVSVLQFSPYIGWESSFKEGRHGYFNSFSIGTTSIPSYAYDGHFLKTYVVPAGEIEFVTPYIKDDKGVLVSGGIVNLNLYLSTNGLRSGGVNIYTTIGGGGGKIGADMSFGAGFGLYNILKVGIKHTHYFFTHNADTSLSLRFNIPIYAVGVALAQLLFEHRIY